MNETVVHETSKIIKAAMIEARETAKENECTSQDDIDNFVAGWLTCTFNNLINERSK